MRPATPGSESPCPRCGKEARRLQALHEAVLSIREALESGMSLRCQNPEDWPGVWCHEDRTKAPWAVWGLQGVPLNRMSWRCSGGP